MELRIIKQADLVQLQLVGELDEAGVDTIAPQFQQLVLQHDLPVLIDLAEVDFIVSRGMGLLVKGAKQLERAGHRMVLYRPQAFVDKGLKIARIDHVIPIYRDWSQARRYLLRE